jgi:hypothetical protein
MFMVPRRARSPNAASRNADHGRSPVNEKAPIIVVLGIDVDGKPHASRFEQHDAQFVVRAAELMGFHVIHVPPENAELHVVAEGLPAGKIYATGRAFVPFVGRAAFDKLTTLVEGGVTLIQRGKSGAGLIRPRADMLTTDAINTAEALWSKIEVGTEVLAEEPELYGPGWWQGVVVAVNGNDLTVRWLDDPDEDPIKVERRHVALRHPGV